VKIVFETCPLMEIGKNRKTEREWMITALSRYACCDVHG